MPQALVVSGHEPWQFKSSRWIARFLREQTRIRYAPVFDGLGSTEAEFIARLKRALGEGRANDLLVVWLNTHGSAEGWLSLDHGVFIHMNAVAAMLAQSDRKVLLVVNSCHSGLMADALELEKVDPERIGCIMACQKDRVTYNGYLVEAVADAWYERQTYQAGIVESCEEIKRLPPIGTIRIGNPFLRAYDRAKFWFARWAFAIAEFLDPSYDRSIRSERWGARPDSWLWRRRQRRA